MTNEHYKQLYPENLQICFDPCGYFLRYINGADASSVRPPACRHISPTSCTVTLCSSLAELLTLPVAPLNHKMPS